MSFEKLTKSLYVYLGIVIFVILIVGCPDNHTVPPQETGKGTVHINLSGGERLSNVVRTLLPSQVDLTKLHFVITFTQSGGNGQHTVSQNGKTPVIVQLSEGTWNLDIRGHILQASAPDASAAIVYYIENGITITAGANVTVNAKLLPNTGNMTQNGTGTLSYDITIPQGSTGIFSVLSLNGNLIGSPFSLNQTVTQSEQDLASGEYNIKISIVHEGEEKEWWALVHIYDSTITKVVVTPIDFTNVLPNFPTLTITLSMDDFTITDEGHGVFDHVDIPIILNKNEGTSVNVTVSDLNVIAWRVGSTIIGMGSSITLNANNFNIGSFILNLTFTKNNKTWQSNLAFTVTNDSTTTTEEVTTTTYFTTTSTTQNNSTTTTEETITTTSTSITTTTIFDKVATFTPIAAGFDHSLAIDNSDNLWAWGNNSGGILGDGTTTNRLSPVQIKSETAFKAIAASFMHSLAMDNTGNLWAWGYNNDGRLGDGTTTSRYSPVQINPGTKFTAVATGYNYSFAIDNSGNLWAWGNNNFGQLGDGTTTNRYSPVQIKEGTKFIAVAAGFNHSLAIDENGNLWAWGYNGYGQLGDGTTTSRYSPVQIKNGTKFIAVAAGYYHSLAIDIYGNLWAWGYNSYGQLGNGTSDNKNSPIQIKEEIKFTAIAAGEHHSLGTDVNNNLWTWGYNGSGQLGDGTINVNMFPTIIPIPPTTTINTTTTTSSTTEEVTTTTYSTTTSTTQNNSTTTTEEITTTTSSTTTSTTIDPSAIYVSVLTGSDSNDGSKASPYKTIQKAIDNVNSEKYNVYIAMGTYLELINITSTISMSIKGGYNDSWERTNSDDKSNINGSNPTTTNTGRITIGVNGDVLLENLNIAGIRYSNIAYGIYSNGKLTIQNCDIAAIKSGSATNVYGIYNNSELKLLSGTIIGAGGSANVNSTSRVAYVLSYGIYNNNNGIINISGGMIKGATDNVIIQGFNGNSSSDAAKLAGSANVCGVYSNNPGTITISGGTVIGATDNVTATGGTPYSYSNYSAGSAIAYGIYGGTITVLGGTVIGVTDNIQLKSGFSVGGSAGSAIAYGVYGSAITISSGTVIGATDNVIIQGFNGNSSAIAYGVYGGATITGGTIMGATDTVESNNVYGVYGGTITISSGTVIGATNTVKSSNIYGVYGSGIVTISTCEIYGKEPTITTGTANALFKGSSAYFYKGGSPAIIENIKGDGTNLWNSGFIWD